MVNGRKLDIPSYLVRPGDQIQVKNREHSRKLAADNLAPRACPGPRLARPDQHRPARRPGQPACPRTQDISLPVTPQLIVELLSR